MDPARGRARVASRARPRPALGFKPFSKASSNSNAKVTKIKATEVIDLVGRFTANEAHRHRPVATTLKKKYVIVSTSPLRISVKAMYTSEAQTTP